jgi:FlaA1/EpsC-like NDP-sugar epimerase
MTMAEAVALVQNTLETMQGGELNIPTLPAYKLADLAVAMDCYGISTGLPEWEKLHESMCEGRSSEDVRRMSIDELREALKYV